MGIAIIIYGQVILTLVLFLGVVIGGCKLIGFAARPGTASVASSIVIVLGVMTLLGSAVLGNQLKNGGSTLTASNWENRYCGTAGEEIFKTVDNVRGVYYRPPSNAHSYSRFHENDGDPRAYLSRPDRAYDFFEVKRNPNELLERHELKDAKIAFSRQDLPTARYAFTWSPITSRQEIQAGVRGEELEVFDRETGEVLGRRVLFAYAPSSGSQPLGTPLPVCPRSILGPELGFLDGQPRDSYKFVAKILKPPVRAGGSEAADYDLYRGSGYQRKSCVGYIRIGREISPSDLSFQQIGHDLHIKIRSTEDVLNCEMKASAARGPDPYAPFKFADGHVMPSRDFYSRIRVAPEKRN